MYFKILFLEDVDGLYYEFGIKMPVQSDFFTQYSRSRKGLQTPPPFQLAPSQSHAHTWDALSSQKKISFCPTFHWRAASGELSVATTAGLQPPPRVHTHTHPCRVRTHTWTSVETQGHLVSFTSPHEDRGSVPGPQPRHSPGFKWHPKYK